MSGRVLPTSTAITATDLNQPMIDHAKAMRGVERVTWRQLWDVVNASRSSQHS
jgi:hypothetical protein